MEELSLHLLDLIQNSVSAGASLVRILISETGDELTISLEDNGCGMSPELLERVVSPFATTRTTRKVGLGIPMFRQAALSTGGRFDITSQKGVGTRIDAVFSLSHIDRAPMGDLAGTMLSQVLMTPDTPDYYLNYRVGDAEFEFDTLEIKQMLGGVPLTEPDVAVWIKSFLQEGLESLNGGA